jgi:hypothetical protein
MRRGGPPAHSAAPPNSWSCPARMSWTEIATSGQGCLECIEPLRPGRHEPASSHRRAKAKPCDWRRSAAADHLGPTRGTCDKRPQLGRAGPFQCSGPGCRADNDARSQVSRAGPGDVIMNDTNSEGWGGWQDISSRKSLHNYGQIACGTLGGLSGRRRSTATPTFPIDGRALQTRRSRHDPPLFQPLSGHRAPAPGGV